ncbi:NADH-quinone oxidoreductase subunit K [Myxococcota bacterium]|nr:NADH-quinone oxidoreductase subunit K [Myxococcota bacterium]
MTSGIDDLQWLVFGALALFWVGLLGLVLRRSLVGMLVGLGFAWFSVSAVVIAFGLLSGSGERAVAAGGFALCTAIVGCLQVVVGLALVFARVGRKGSIDAEEARLLEG